jgi:sugar lactone lactonase YvrE
MARIIRLVQLAVLCTLLALASAESILVDIGLVQHFLGNDTTPGSASGAGPNALLKGPSGCAVGSNGMFYFCDTLNRVVRRTLMGSAQADIWLGALNVPQDKPGQGTAARVTAPWSFKIMPDETKAYLMDFASHKIYAVVLTSAVMQNWAGTGLPGNNDGTGGSAQFNGPVDMTFHRSTLDMYITESLGHRIRKATQTSVITLFCGSATSVAGMANARGSQARFDAPQGIELFQTRNLMYVADSNNKVIRTVALDSAQAGVIAGSGSTGQDDGVGIVAAFGAPFGLALDNGGKFLFIADRGSNLVRRMDTNTLLVVTVAGTGAAGWSSSVSSVEAMVSAPSGLCINRNTNVMYITGDHSVSFVFKSKTMTSSATIRLKRTPTLGRGQTRAPTGGNTDQGSSAPAAAGISVVAVATATLLLLFHVVA